MHLDPDNLTKSKALAQLFVTVRLILFPFMDEQTETQGHWLVPGWVPVLETELAL